MDGDRYWLTAATCHRAWSEKFASTPRSLPRGRQNLPFARPQEPICRGELGREIGNDRHRRQCQRVAGQRAKAFHWPYRHADAQPRYRTIATGTDDLQGKIDAMSNSAIDAAIPSSYYSNVIFNWRKRDGDGRRTGFLRWRRHWTLTVRSLCA